MDLTCFGECLLSNSRAYEVSKWFQRIQKRIRRESNRMMHRSLWCDLAHQSLFRQNISDIDSTFIEYRKRRDTETMVILTKWKKLVQLLVLAEIAKKVMKGEKRSRSEDRARRLWTYMMHAYRINCMAERLKKMKPKRRASRGKRRWISLAKRFLHKSQIDLLESESRMLESYSTEVEISDSEQHSQSFQKWQDLSNEFLRANQRRNLELEARWIKIRRTRVNAWRQICANYATERRRDEFSISADNLRAARDTWIDFITLYKQRAYREEMRKAHESIELMHKWQSLSQRVARKHIKNTIQQEIACQAATEHGTRFLMNKLMGVEELVQMNVRNRFDDYRRTIRSDFWREADFTGYSLTRKMLFDSINTVLPKLTDQASQTATVFSKCQNVLTHAKRNHEMQAKPKQKKQRDVHVIIKFTRGDEEDGLLDLC